MLEMTRSRPSPPSLADPPEWLAQLQGIELFRARRTEHGWTGMPEGRAEDVEFPGGTWRAVMVMAADLSLTAGCVDPVVLLVALAHGASNTDHKIQELAA